MPQCKHVRNIKNKVCSGDLNIPVSLQSRAQVPPYPGELEGSYEFADIVNPLWCFCYTLTGRLSGVARFSGVNIHEDATHLWQTRYDPTVKGAEAGNNFILHDERYFRILEVTNDNENNSLIIIQTKEVGDADKAASEA